MKEERYFYIPDAAQQQEMPADEAVHAVRVLRLKEGDEVFLMDGNGTFHKAEITLATQRRCMYRITESMPQQRMWKGRIHLAIAPTKMMERMEWMVEKATEVGFDEITFLNCRFSERTKLRTDRIEKIIVGAVKQSRKAWMPKVNDMTDFKTFIAEHQQGRRYICHCYEEYPKQDFFQMLAQSVGIASDTTSDSEVIVLVGPEGDFSTDEVQLALDNGYVSTSLGTSRLRTETAGLSAVMMANLLLRNQN